MHAYAHSQARLQEDEESLSLARLQEEYAVLKQVNEVLVKRNNQQELAVVRASREIKRLEGEIESAHLLVSVLSKQGSGRMYATSNLSLRKPGFYVLSSYKDLI